MKFTGKAFAIIAFLLPQVMWAGGKTTSLIFAEYKEDLRGNKVGNLMRYRFQDGILIAKELVLSRKTVDLQYSSGVNYLVKNRYLITRHGNVIDIRDRKILYQQRDKNIYFDGELDKNRIILTRIDEQRHPIECLYYDLKSGESGKLPNRGKWLMPGMRSPDETHSVISDGAEIRLYDLKGNSTLLGSKFLSPLSLYAAYEGHIGFQAPMLWLDNEHILTQKDHGKIVILKTDGTIEPVIDIPLDASVISKIRSSPELFRDAAGNITYEFWGDERHSFALDLQHKTFSSNDKMLVGNGFDKLYKEHPCILRYQGKEIGKCLVGYKSWTTSSGYLASENLEPDGSQSDIPGFKVWNRYTRKWQVFPVDDLADLVGWIED